MHHPKRSSSKGIKICQREAVRGGLLPGVITANISDKYEYVQKCACLVMDYIIYVLLIDEYKKTPGSKWRPNSVHNDEATRLTVRKNNPLTQGHG